MTRSPFTLVDSRRVEQFTLLGRGRSILEDAETYVDGTGVAWAIKQVGDVGLAVTWLGPGAVFDPVAEAHGVVNGLDKRRAAMVGANGERHDRELAAVARRLVLGERSTRLLWALHRLVLTSRSSVIAAPDVSLASAVWGAKRSGWPKNWRATILSLLESLTWVHVFETQEGSPLQLGAESVLLHHVEDLRNAEDGTCGDCCEGHGRHHHILVNVGRGFLGVLEQFAAADDEPGVRTYSFPINSPKGCPSLKRVGKTGRLVSVYLPAELAPASAPQLTAAQRRVMRAAVRELTRAHKKNPEPGEAQPVIGGAVPDYAGRRNAACPLLTSTSRYVAFGGNGVRKGQGYRLTSPGGWLAKAGYAAGAIAEFLSDLSTLAATLGLTVVGIDANNRWHDLPSLRAMAGHIPGRRVLDRVHLRVYGSADYIERWNAIFEWSTDTPVATEGPSATVARAMADAGVSRRAVAKGVGADPSFFSKVLAGKKPWPAGLAERALGWLSTLRHPSVEAPPHSETVTIPGPPQVLATALANRARGWSIVPIISATKRPPIRWKEFQTRVATETELTDWFRRWPDAGLALVLGPVSNVFAIDVDGPEAHAALVKRLGSEPVAPKTLSGSRKPSRYHLLFTDPGVATRAKATPWHEKLEFRGQGGLVVLPPSLHPSGHRYEWSPGRSPDDLPLPAVPAILREALAPSKPAPRPARRSQATMPVTGAFSPSTAQFLAGTYANGPKWNDRLFEAACDLAGRGYSFDEAEPLLMAGADPWNSDEAERASRTIQSAFAQTRSPGQT